MNPKQDNFSLISKKPIINASLRGLFWTLPQSIIPGILIWVFFSHFTNIFHLSLSVNYLLIISLAFLGWTFITTLILYKFHQYGIEQFTFTIPLTLLFIALLNLTFTNLNYLWWMTIIIGIIFISVLFINIFITFIASFTNEKFDKPLKKSKL